MNVLGLLKMDSRLAQNTGSSIAIGIVRGNDYTLLNSAKSF